MKSRFLIWLSTIALLVLIAVQYILITETYRTKQHQFDTHFGNLVREAMISFNSQDFNFDFDSVLFLLDNLAVEYQFSPPDSLKLTPGEAFQEVFNQYHQPEVYMSDFIHKAGEDPDFTYHIQIDNLLFLDMGYEQQVYPDSLQLPKAPGEALLAGYFTNERNFFKISYGVFINFYQSVSTDSQ